MRKKYIVFILIFIGVYFLLSVFIRNRAENGHDRPLAVELPTTSRATITALTGNCVTTTLTREHFASGFIGLSVTPWPPDASKYYEKMRDLGVRWMRADIDWRAIEREDGTYDWQSADMLVRDAYANGMTLAADILYQPLYLKTWEETRAHYITFVEAVTTRYMPGGTFAKENNLKDYGITYWEIFNEPNLPGWGWMGKKDNPRQYVGEYAALLAIASNAIHTIDAQAHIILGGVSSDTYGMSYQEFFEELYSYGVGKCFDIIAFHPYGKEGQFRKVAEELQMIASRHGIEGKQLWFNEYGTDKDNKLDWTFSSMLMERDAADAWFWFTLRDLRPNHRLGYGLMNYEFQPKPVYEKFKATLHDTSLPLQL